LLDDAIKFKFSFSNLLMAWITLALEIWYKEDGTELAQLPTPGLFNGGQHSCKFSYILVGGTNPLDLSADKQTQNLSCK
jgi:hypothetical protein